jgi:hypothetical protein
MEKNPSAPKVLDCKICEQSFRSERSLHGHLKKHKTSIAEYYCNFFPRIDLWDQSPIPFKNKNDYFLRDFVNFDNLRLWCLHQPKDIVSKYILELLERRVEEKKLEFAPSSIELASLNLPSIDMYKYFFGSYTDACEKINCKPLYPNPIPKNFFKPNEKMKEVAIFVDTREQNPLEFKKTKNKKLDFGDYTVGGDLYSYTYVDRKSESDFRGTFGGGIERFKKELDRAKQFESFLYVVVECSMKDIESNNHYSSNIPYIHHNIREIIHKYPKTCQFLFTGNRENSEEIIPKLLTYGDKIWGCDLQYHFDKFHSNDSKGSEQNQ